MRKTFGSYSFVILLMTTSLVLNWTRTYPTMRCWDTLKMRKFSTNFHGKGLYLRGHSKVLTRTSSASVSSFCLKRQRVRMIRWKRRFQRSRKTIGGKKRLKDELARSMRLSRRRLQRYLQQRKSLRPNIVCMNLHQHSNTGHMKLYLALALSLPHLWGTRWQGC